MNAELELSEFLMYGGDDRTKVGLSNSEPLDNVMGGISRESDP